MKTYDKLSNKDKSKFNAMVLCTFPYVILLHGLLIVYVMLMLAGAILICLSPILDFALFFYGLILISGGLFMAFLMRTTTIKYKNKMKQYFGIKDEEEILKE